MDHRKIPSSDDPVWEPEGREVVVNGTCIDVADQEVHLLAAQVDAFAPRGIGMISAYRILAALGWILLNEEEV